MFNKIKRRGELHKILCVVCKKEILSFYGYKKLYCDRCAYETVKKKIIAYNRKKAIEEKRLWAKFTEEEKLILMEERAKALLREYEKEEEQGIDTSKIFKDYRKKVNKRKRKRQNESKQKTY